MSYMHSYCPSQKPGYFFVTMTLCIDELFVVALNETIVCNLFSLHWHDLLRRLFATEIHVMEDPRNNGAMPAKFQIFNRDGTLRRNSCLKREQSCSHFQKWEPIRLSFPDCVNSSTHCTYIDNLYNV